MPARRVPRSTGRPDTSLNYHHLRYFWIVAREGGIAHASDLLDVAPSTISGQISKLEESLGVRLFRRSGRNLALTAAGESAYRFAEEIFLLGRDLTETLRGRPAGHPARLAVGVADVVPKVVATRLLEPALALPDGVRLLCSEGKPQSLLAELALHRFDLILLDTPAPPGESSRAASHRLAELPVLLLGCEELVERYRDGFPASLDGAPFLLPTHESALRPLLDRWLDGQGIRPKVVAEFDDSALMKTFGQRGLGLLPAPDVATRELGRQYRLHSLGRLEPLRMPFYAVTGDRGVEHPAIAAVLAAPSLGSERPDAG